VSCKELEDAGYPDGEGYYLRSNPDQSVVCVDGALVYEPPFEVIGQPEHYWPFDKYVPVVCHTA